MLYAVYSSTAADLKYPSISECSLFDFSLSRDDRSRFSRVNFIHVFLSTNLQEMLLQIIPSI